MTKWNQMWLATLVAAFTVVVVVSGQVILRQAAVEIVPWPWGSRVSPSVRMYVTRSTGVTDQRTIGWLFPIAELVRAENWRNGELIEGHEGTPLEATYVETATEGEWYVHRCPIESGYVEGCGLGDFWESVVAALETAGYEPYRTVLRVLESEASCTRVALAGVKYIAYVTRPVTTPKWVTLHLGTGVQTWRPIPTCHTLGDMERYLSGDYW